MATDGTELDRAWDDNADGFFERYRERILGRIDVLQEIADEQSPGPERIAAARIEAHKLHGLLGTIGLPDGSELAAEIESRLEAGSAEIGSDVADLRAMVNAH